jgi:hypothetical protein
MPRRWREIDSRAGHRRIRKRQHPSPQCSLFHGMSPVRGILPRSVLRHFFYVRSSTRSRRAYRRARLIARCDTTSGFLDWHASVCSSSNLGRDMGQFADSQTTCYSTAGFDTVPFLFSIPRNEKENVPRQCLRIPSPQFYFRAPLRFMWRNYVEHLVFGTNDIVLPYIPDVGAGKMVCTILRS